MPLFFLAGMPPETLAFGPKRAEESQLGRAAMKDPHFVLLYVDSPEKSSIFYAALLGRPPVEASKTFAMFALSPGLMLGLWSRHTVVPAAAGGGGGAELAFTAGSVEEVRAVHADWLRLGLEVLQAPAALDFGFTFVAQDPDGHRLRVFAPGAVDAVP